MPNVELSREDAYLVHRLLTEMERDERLDEQYRRYLRHEYDSVRFDTIRQLPCCLRIEGCKFL